MHSMQRIEATSYTGSRLSTHFSSGKTASISNRKIVVNSVVNNAQNHQHVSRINKRHEETSRFQLKRETQDLSIVERIGSERRGALLRTRAANIPDSFDPSKYDGTGAAEGEDEGKPATLMETLFGGDGWNKGRTRPPAKDRLLAILPYLIPMMGCIAFTNDGFEFFPLTLQFLDFFTAPMMIFYSNGFIPFCTFFGLFLAVVRNPKVPHFIRYNTMQAIMLDICIMLAGLIMQYLPPLPRGHLLWCFGRNLSFCQRHVRYFVLRLERRARLVPRKSQSSPKRCTRKSRKVFKTRTILVRMKIKQRLNKKGEKKRESRK
ncbi:unnamed protein product [Bathycoccus prasinos]